MIVKKIQTFLIYGKPKKYSIVVSHSVFTSLCFVFTSLSLLNLMNNSSLFVFNITSLISAKIKESNVISCSNLVEIGSMFKVLLAGI